MSSFARGISKAALEKAGVKVQAGDMGSDLEGEFADVLHKAGVLWPQREVQPVPDRRWACDFVWSAQRLIVEVEGGTFSGGRHVRGQGFADDCVKYNTLTLRGWRVLRITGAHIKSGEALAWVEWALEERV